MASPRLFHLTARCPDCGAPPRLRFASPLRTLLAGARPDQVLMTYQCHKDFRDGRICGRVYEIRAGDFRVE